MTELLKKEHSTPNFFERRHAARKVWGFLNTVALKCVLLLAGWQTEFRRSLCGFFFRFVYHFGDRIGRWRCSYKWAQGRSVLHVGSLRTLQTTSRSAMCLYVCCDLISSAGNNTVHSTGMQWTIIAVLWLPEKFPAFYGSQKFFTVFKRVR